VGLRSALWLPLFDELADPAAVARLAAEAEEAGWHGLFVWDNVNWRAPVRQVADPWITLAAAAGVTERLRLGPMVTPLARRRPAKVARETATLDLLSGGRLTLGVGLGSDRFAGELSATGEQLDDRQRAQMLDEALQILTTAWSGRPVQHRGAYYTVDGIRFLPRPVQRPGVPVWVAGLRPDPAAPYDIAVALPPGTDPAPYAAAGATWWLTEFEPEAVSLDRVRGVLRDGPAGR
jgi:alkanesulfonate monooxygenase SsuD/methylene tetrahydromethanopterin reductase-like flavin-dependent oxidoreductase (luciferase family)